MRAGWIALACALMVGHRAGAAECDTAAPCAVKGGSYVALRPHYPPRGAMLFLHGYGGSGAEEMKHQNLWRQVTEPGLPDGLSHRRADAPRLPDQMEFRSRPRAPRRHRLYRRRGGGCGSPFRLCAARGTRRRLLRGRDDDLAPRLRQPRRFRRLRARLGRHVGTRAPPGASVPSACSIPMAGAIPPFRSKAAPSRATPSGKATSSRNSPRCGTPAAAGPACRAGSRRSASTPSAAGPTARRKPTSSSRCIPAGHEIPDGWPDMVLDWFETPAGPLSLDARNG